MDTNIFEKFRDLLNLLLYSKTEFEIVADEIGDHRLKTALNGFSEESDIYINELCSHLQPLGFEYRHPKVLPALDVLIQEVELSTGNNHGNELQCLCNSSEKYITATYHEILNGPFPFPVIKEIMIYQLGTLQSIFNKINFLNIARLSN